MKYIKAPFNYVGGKYKILPQIIPKFPQSIKCMADVFGGAFNVGINTNADYYVYNDMITPLVQLQQYIYSNNVEDILKYIHDRIDEYELSKTDKWSFNRFREDYNNEEWKHPLDLYILMSFSFNYSARWNNKMEYNSSHGTNRSTYSKTLEKRLIKYISNLQEKTVSFNNKDFTQIKYQKLTTDDFIYFDPPYLLSTANYNDGKRGFKNWTTLQEKQLYNILEHLTDKGIPWGLNNMITHKNKNNHYLSRFINDNKDNLNVYVMNNNFNNSNYNLKDKNTDTIELYITNIW